MKTSLRSSHSSYLKTGLLLIWLALCFVGATCAQAGATDSSSGPLRAGQNYRTESPQGYLMVFSATDRFDDGGTFYYAHSSYSIYTTDGKLLKNVENHLSRSDETPALVILPAGSYTIEARSEGRGYVRVPIVIIAGRRTILDPDEEQTELQKRFARPRDSRRVAEASTRGSGSVRNFSILRKLA